MSFGFKKLPKEKQQHLALVLVGTAAVLGALGWFVIKSQYEGLADAKNKKDTALTRHTQVEDTIKKAARVEEELATLTKTLDDTEAGMTAGDHYSWFIGMLKQFKLGYKVELPQISTVETENVDLLPKFPYKQATVKVEGTAYYHDLGKFIADFENKFPHIRLVNLVIEPVSTVLGGDREKLRFTMEIVALVKPG